MRPEGAEGDSGVSEYVSPTRESTEQETAGPRDDHDASFDEQSGAANQMRLGSAAVRDERGYTGDNPRDGG